MGEQAQMETLTRTRVIPQPSLSAAAAPGRPARASESSTDCATRGGAGPHDQAS